MSMTEQPPRGTDQDEPDASGTEDASHHSGRVEETNEPVEAEAVDDVTPTNEPEEEREHPA